MHSPLLFPPPPSLVLLPAHRSDKVGRDTFIDRPSFATGVVIVMQSAIGELVPAAAPAAKPQIVTDELKRKL
jgi:hypothetical protein